MAEPEQSRQEPLRRESTADQRGLARPQQPIRQTAPPTGDAHVQQGPAVPRYAPPQSNAGYPMAPQTAPGQTNPYSYATPAMWAPVGQVRTDRSPLKYILLGVITLGIYGIVVMTESVDTLNTIASRYDGKRTMHYCLMYFLVGWVTCGIAWFVWFHRMSNRLGDELERRGHQRLLSASDYWLWSVLGAFIIVGPFIYLYKFFTAMNELAADYNARG